MDARGSVSDCTSAGVDRRSAIPSLLLALLTLAGAPASGDTLYWDSGGGADQSWANPANWNPGFVPRYSGNGTSAEDAAEINNGGTARVTATGYGAMELVLGRASHESGTLHLVYLAADLGEALFVEKRVFVGLFGTGMLTLRNGAKLMSDREDYVGDGAGAAVLGPSDRRRIVYSKMGSDGSGGDMMKLPAGGSRMPTTIETVQDKLHYMVIRGREVFKFAVIKMQDCIQDVLDANGYHADDISLIVPHQVNFRILKAAADKFGLPMEKVQVNIERYGNTAAASLPMALDEAIKTRDLKEGDVVILVAFGGGLTWGANVVQF